MTDLYSAVTDRDGLHAALRRDLAHCDCGSDGTIPALERLLAAGAEPHATRSAAVEAVLTGYGSPPLACWFVYLLEKAGLVVHGWNVFDVETTDAGRSLLAAVRRTSPTHLSVADEPPL